jgi:hypothetical protein
LLTREIDGRVHRCTLSPQAMASAAAWLEKQRLYWNSALDRLDALLARPSGKEKKK